ncbi:hypothetical protein Nmn1133_13880 [Halosegnis longus]|uniref:Uncharacterized protein n=1 Tax=Halosegnis longus TaxID=2216012 RepID=A0AAJ4R545_9EURY|nr:hypothetical protein Nmn1133_13880 [Salella cibi]
MRRVKNRTLYDTETAEQIAKHGSAADLSDFHHLAETLYKTADGEYFIHGQGGAGTKYATQTSNGSTNGQEIRRLTQEQALKWCEDQSIDGDIAVEEFGELITNVEPTD